MRQIFPTSSTLLCGEKKAPTLPRSSNLPRKTELPIRILHSTGKIVMTDRIFIDSNIWCYLFIQDEYEKYKVSEKFLQNNRENTLFIITYQVINEVTNRLIKKSFSEEKIRETLLYMYKICTIQDFSQNIILTASALRGKYSLSFWDSIIVASALEAHCSILASEDMQNGLHINNMIVKNIYKKESA